MLYMGQEVSTDPGDLCASVNPDWLEAMVHPTDGYTWTSEDTGITWQIVQAGAPGVNVQQRPKSAAKKFYERPIVWIAGGALALFLLRR